jgi:hypothetical protein
MSILWPSGGSVTSTARRVAAVASNSPTKSMRICLLTVDHIT